VTTELAVRSTSALSPMPPAELRVSTALAQAYEATRNPHPDVGRPRSYPAAVQAEARLAAKALRPFALPVGEATLREWLAVVPISVGHRLSAAEVEAWLVVVAQAVGHLERGAFTRASQAQALRTFKSFPSAAHIYEILAPAAVEIRQRLRTLERIAEAPTLEANATC